MKIGVGLSLKGRVLNITLSARLAQSVEHETLNLRVVGSSPTLGVNFFVSFLVLSKLMC